MPGLSMRLAPRGRSLGGPRRVPVRVPLDGKSFDGVPQPGPGEIFFPGLPGETEGESFPDQPSTAGASSFVLGFEGEAAGDEDVATSGNGTIELPEDFNLEELDLEDLKSMSDISTVEDFIRVLGLPEPTEAEVHLRTAGPAPVLATSASCTPENRTVHLPLPLTDGNLYFPTCVRLPRCGGCCASRQLKCRPTEVLPRKFKVLSIAPSSSNARRSMSSDGGRRRTSRRGRSLRRNTRSRRNKRQTTNYYYVDEVEHRACACLCRVTDTDCDPAVHDYDKTNCQCKCRNIDEQQKCLARAADHYWDAATCRCLCSKTASCSTTQFFDHASCTCRNNH